MISARKAQLDVKKNRLNKQKQTTVLVMLHAPLLLSLFARERGFYCFPGFCFSRGKHSIAWKGIITSHASGLFKLAIKNEFSLFLLFLARRWAKYRNQQWMQL